MDENQKQKRILMIASLIVVLTLVLGVSFAYFLAQGQSAEQTVTTATLALEFDDNTPIINESDIAPIKRDEVLTKATKKTFTIKNTGDKKMYVDISLEDMVIPADLQRYDFVWSLYEGNTNVSNGTFSNSGTSLTIGEYLVFEAPVINGDTTTYDEKTYNLYIWIDETGVNQSDMMGETFKATIKAEGREYYTSPESDFIVNSSGVLEDYVGPGGEVVIPPVVNGRTVTSIGPISFCHEDDTYTKVGEGVTKLVIPNTITSIDYDSFIGNNITNLFIPNSVTEIGENAFWGNSLTFVSIPNSVAYIDSAVFTNNDLDSIFIPNGVETMRHSVFDNCTTTNGIVIPSSVKNITWANFQNNPNLSLITVQGKSSAPSTFEDGWNLISSDSDDTINTVYVP